MDVFGFAQCAGKEGSQNGCELTWLTNWWSRVPKSTLLHTAAHISARSRRLTFHTCWWVEASGNPFIPRYLEVLQTVAQLGFSQFKKHYGKVSYVIFKLLTSTDYCKTCHRWFEMLDILREKGPTWARSDAGTESSSRGEDSQRCWPAPFLTPPLLLLPFLLLLLLPVIMYAHVSFPVLLHPLHQ